MQTTFQELYKRDSKGKVRVWYMEQDGDKYRTFDGVRDGTVKASAWRTAKPTNVGRSNERDGVAQATFEISASYVKQLKGAYYESLADIDLGCRYTEPMLADKYKTFKPGDVQPKLDGFRCIIKAEGGFSREGEVLPGAGHLHAILKPIFDRAPNLMLDGELYNHELGDDFNELGSLIKKGAPSPERQAEVEAKVQYHVYDIASMTDKPWSERRVALQALVKAINHPSIIFVDTVSVGAEDLYDQLHAEWVGTGFEGSMWRDRNALYEQGKRSKHLLKRKDFDDEEFDLIPNGIEEGEGNWAGAAKRAVFWLPHADRTIDLSNEKLRKENTFEAGLRGDKATGIKLLAERDRYTKATVRYFGWTPSEIPKPRFGVVTKFWEGERDL